MVSTTARCPPPASVSASRACTSTASGVLVWASLGRRSPAPLEATVLIIPVAKPAPSRIDVVRAQVVVLPSVPVTPTIPRPAAGNP